MGELSGEALHWDIAASLSGKVQVSPAKLQNLDHSFRGYGRACDAAVVAGVLLSVIFGVWRMSR